VSGLDSVTDANFEEYVLNNGVPVLVDFWAQWCGPCRSLGPTLERIAQKYEGRVLIVKCDVDRNPTMRQHYNVRNIPRMLLFKDGQQVGSLLGAHAQPQIEQLLDKHCPPIMQVVPEPAPTAPEPMNSLDDLIQPGGRRR
jgi:thioredoxin 1